MKSQIIGFIGVGNMAGAIIKGICDHKVVEPSQLRLLNPTREKLKPYLSLGAKACCNLNELIQQSDIVFFCVKPQVLSDVLKELSSLMRPERQVYVSIVAGKNAEYFFSFLGPCKLILTMPNTPLLLGKGATAMGEGYYTSEEEFSFVRNIFLSSGMVEEIPAEKLTESIAVSGSSPAFLYRFCKIVADRAEEMGLEKKTAISLFAATMEGAAAMILHSGYSIEELIRMVSSPGGTTLAGLSSLDQSGFDESIKKCMDACVKRAYELGK